jgi:hypothetical protein
MTMLGAIDRKPDKKTVVAEKPAPFVGKRCSIGLDRIFDNPFPSILFLQFNDLPEEVHPPHDRLSTVPGELNVGSPAGIDVLRDEIFEHLFTHRPSFGIVRVEFLLLKVVAIGAIQITNGSDGLCHHVERIHAGKNRIF